ATTEIYTLSLPTLFRSHVLVLVVGGAVKYLESSDGHRAAGESHDKGGVFGRESLQGPYGGIACHRVEPFEIVLTGGGAVVIAAHDHGAGPADPIADRVGVGAVA